MKKQRFTEEQIIGVLKEQEAGVKAADLCEPPQVSGPTEARVFRLHSGRQAG
jgi:putative transposase